MKNIQVSDEIYNGLKKIATELNNQDHRGTAMPYFFQVQTKHKVACPEGNGYEAWFYDGTLIETKEEIEEAILEYYELEISEKEISELSEWEIETKMKNAGYSKVNYDYETRLENAFFTEKACKKHIDNNRHNLKSPVDYLSHAFRNPEMELISKFLLELVGGKIHK